MSNPSPGETRVTEFSQEDPGPDKAVKVALVVRTLSPGATQADPHIVLTEHRDDTLTVHLWAMGEAPARRTSSVESHTESSEKSRFHKRKCEKKKNRRCRSSSDSRSVQRGRRTERSADRDVVNKARTLHDPTEQTEACRVEACGLSPDRPLELDACETVSSVRHSVPVKVDTRVGTTARGRRELREADIC